MWKYRYKHQLITYKSFAWEWAALWLQLKIKNTFILMTSLCMLFGLCMCMNNYHRTLHLNFLIKADLGIALFSAYLASIRSHQLNSSHSSKKKHLSTFTNLSYILFPFCFNYLMDISATITKCNYDKPLDFVIQHCQWMSRFHTYAFISQLVQKCLVKPLRMILYIN